MRIDLSSPDQSSADHGGNGALIHPGYEIRDGISEDATGILYRGRKIPENRNVAIRLFDGDIKPHAQPSRANTLPSMLRILLASEYLQTEKGVPFAVFDMPEGRCLETDLDGNVSIPMDAAARIALEVSLTVRALHVHGLCHGHVNAQNVFLKRQPDGRMEIRLLYHPLDGEPSRFNLPEYLSPELCREQSALSKSDDLWAITVLFYRMVTGSAPFAGTSKNEVWQTMEQTAFALPGEGTALSPMATDFFERSLGKSVNDRPDGRELNLCIKSILKDAQGETVVMNPLVSPLPISDRPTVPPDKEAAEIKAAERNATEFAEVTDFTDINDTYGDSVKRTTRPVPAEDTLLLGKDEELLHSEADDDSIIDFDFDSDMEIDIESNLDVDETQGSLPSGLQSDAPSAWGGVVAFSETRPADTSVPVMRNESEFMAFSPISMSSPNTQDSPGDPLIEWALDENEMVSTKASINTSLIAVAEQRKVKRMRVLKLAFVNISIGIVAAALLYLFSGKSGFRLLEAEESATITETTAAATSEISAAESEVLLQSPPSAQPAVQNAVAQKPAGEVTFAIENLPENAHILVNGSRRENPVVVPKSTEPLEIKVVAEEQTIYSTTISPERDRVIALATPAVPQKAKRKTKRRAGKARAGKRPEGRKKKRPRLSSNPHQLRGNPFSKVNTR